jgi:cell shape-determining protein MreC
MKSDLSKEEMLKRLQKLEEENKRLKEKNKSSLTKEDAFDALKQLIALSTQTYSSL